jgi:TolB protein
LRIHFYRLINLFLLLLLSGCSHFLPPEWKVTQTSGSQDASGASATLTQTPAPTSQPGLTAEPAFPFTATPAISPTPSAVPIPAAINLTRGIKGNPLSPSWSPDGKSVVFTLDDPNQPNHNQLYKAAVDGSGWSKLVEHPGANDFLPQWSPDGAHILFCSTAADGSGTNVFVVAPDGTGLTQLTHDQASQCLAVWSPDSRMIALISDRKNQQTAHLYVMNADGTNLHLAADVNNATDPVWAPDGNTLVFSGLDRSGSGAGMYSARPDGSGFIQLIKDAAFEAGMQWSPDGKKIIFQADASLFMINADSSGKVQVLPKQPSMSGEAWSPDGGWIAYSSTLIDDAQIFTMTVDGTTLLYYPHPGMQDLFPLWSPDGRKLLFYSHHDHVDNGSLLVIPMDALNVYVK